MVYKFQYKKYNKIDDVVKLINLIDNKIIGKEKVYDLNLNLILNVEITKSSNAKYDYACMTNVYYSNKDIKKYMGEKFLQIENAIKLNYKEYGNNWYIDFKITNFDFDFYDH